MSTNTPNIRWTAIEHSLSRVKGSGKHVILVGYQPDGPILNKVVAVSALYNLMDYDLSGWVSPTEFLWGHGSGLFDPHHVFKFMKEGSKTCFVADAARQKRDYALYNETIMGLLKNTHEVCSVALTEIMVDKAIMPGVQLNLANTGLAELGKISSVAQFVVRTALRWAIVKSICASRG